MQKETGLGLVVLSLPEENFFHPDALVSFLELMLAPGSPMSAPGSPMLTPEFIQMREWLGHNLHI